MLYLNNKLLTSERIIAYFEKNIVHKEHPIGLRSPSLLSQLKHKLKANFFAALIGCDLALKSVAPGDIDVSQLPRTTPMLIKQGEDYFLYARSDRTNNTTQWTLTPLDRHTVSQTRLDFTSDRVLPYHPQYQSLYTHIASKNKQINLRKRPSDDDIKTVLATDDRFRVDYPKLKQVLNQVFTLNDADDKTQALTQLQAIPGTDWNVAENNRAQKQFDEFNQRYRYLKTPPNYDHLVTLFTELAIALRTMIVLFEKNNTRDDTMAYDYAYKLMALYVDPENPTQSTLDTLSKAAYKLVNRIDTDKGHPFHEALLIKLNALPLADDIVDRAGWRKLIREHGVKAFPFFCMAKQLEEKIAEQPDEQGKRAPKDLKKATAMTVLCTYRRAKEDPVFAALCNQCKVDENTFNLCLDYMAEAPGWPKKDRDTLPDLRIKGEGDAEGFYWLKLPVTDKRALILGSPVLTGCCQSIGDHSAQCTKDAVSLNDNGLYVLVKQRKRAACGSE